MFDDALRETEEEGGCGIGDVYREAEPAFRELVREGGESVDGECIISRVCGVAERRTEGGEVENEERDGGWWTIEEDMLD